MKNPLDDPDHWIEDAEGCTPYGFSDPEYPHDVP
jgi:hypothetical protein